MRHDPAGASIVIMLRSLKLYGMANAIEDLVAQGAPAFEAATPMLSQLLKAEIAEREVRSIAYHTKVARFPAYKDLTGFDFASSEINEATVRQLHRCEFIEAAENVVLIGGPGTGKSHTATAIGVQAIEHHRRKVRFFSTVELVNALEQEKALGKAGKLAETLTKVDLVILDELGYLPFSSSGGALLFHLLSKLYERTSGSCRECGGNWRAAGSGHVTMAPVRPRGQGTSARAAEKEFPSRQPSASGSALTPGAPRAASARSRRRAARSGS